MSLGERKKYTCIKGHLYPFLFLFLTTKMRELIFQFEKTNVICEGVLIFFDGFCCCFQVLQGWLGNFKILNVIKKKVSMWAMHASTHHGFCIIQVALMYYAMAKIILSPLRQGRRIVLFFTMRCAFMEEVQLGCN